MKQQPHSDGSTPRRLFLAVLAFLLAASLSGCGTFCGGGAASGGAFAAGCGTTMHF
jgi:hypothetical protein